MPGPYRITDEFDGRELFYTFKLKLPAVRRRAREIANARMNPVIVENTKTNRLLDIIKPETQTKLHDAISYGDDLPDLVRDAHTNPDAWHKAMWRT